MNLLDHWLGENKSKFVGEWKKNEPLSKHTYYKIGGPADYFFSPQSLQDLILLNEGLRLSAIPFFILGAGSNLLVSDHGYRGLILKTNALNRNISDDLVHSQLTIGSSVMVSTLLRMAMHKGWSGLEFLAGVPGSVGGVVFMNAGTHLGETKSAVQNIKYFTLGSEQKEFQLKTFSEQDFEYRKNLFLSKNDIIYEAQFKINLDSPEKVREEIQATLKRRKESQPVDLPSCGSVFKNPYASGMRSWQVIEKCGLRGFRKGDAQFSEKHPNFIVNLGSAKASDVRDLIELAKLKALSDLSIHLEEEVKYLGDFDL